MSEYTEYTPKNPFTVRLLGPMQVWIDGQLMPRLRSRKALWLLALLVLRRDRPVERDWLAGTLWPDIDQTHAFANLRPVVSELRRAMGSQGGRLQSPNRQTLRLDLTGADVDLIRFEDTITHSDPAVLIEAVALYRGELLAGSTEEWLPQERRLRECQCREALKTLAEDALLRGNRERTIAYWCRTVEISPVWEVAQRGLMEAFARDGNTDEALQVYRTYVERRKIDPRAVPDTETTELYLRLRSEARRGPVPSVTAAAKTAKLSIVRGTLPHPRTKLVGRDDERREVADCLRRSRLVTLVGPSGIGKTRLAHAVADEIVGDYADGVGMMSLELCPDKSPVTDVVASLFGLPTGEGHIPLSALSDYLRAKRLLLVLDSAEIVMSEVSDLVCHLLQTCAGVRILITCREPLGIPGETVWTVPGLSVPEVEHLPSGRATLLRVLMGYEGIQLFVERARITLKSFELNAGNALPVARLCQYLAGVPLAIELVAARMSSCTVEEIAEQLLADPTPNYLSFLRSGRSLVSCPQIVRTVLNGSYGLLTEAERLLLQQLSVFPKEGVTLAMVASVCGAEIKSVPVSDLLQALIGYSLVVTVSPESRETEERYRLREPVGQFATEKRVAGGEAMKPGPLPLPLSQFWERGV